MFFFLFLLSFIEVQRPRIIYIETPKKNYDKIPLTNIKVDVEVSGTAAQANYTLKYQNIDNDTLVEAILKFPFDVDVLVSDVFLEYKNKTIIGQIMKNSDAKIIYDNEKQDKNVAMLVRRIDDYISIDLAGIEPNETFTAKLTTYTVLDLKFEHKKENYFTRYIFPTSMVPRYTPLKTEQATTSYSNPNLLSRVNYSFDFNLKTTNGQISSESVSIIKSKTNGTIEWNDRTFSYSGEIPDDVVIDIISQSPKSTIEMTIESFENSTVTEISIPGSILFDFRKSGIQNNSNEKKKESYVFLIDRSGSMYGPPIKNAKSALELFLHSMPSNSIFEIVGFGSQYDPLFHTLVDYNDTTLEIATNYARSIDADLGGTEMLQPLRYILEKRPDHLIFLTDGAVSNVNEVKAYCSRFSTQISTIAIGNYAAKDLLKSISIQSLGTFESVFHMSQIEGAVIRSLSTMRNGFSITSIKSNCGVIYQNFPVLLLPETVSVLRFFNQNGYSNEKVSIELTIKDFLTKNEVSLTINQDDVSATQIEGKKLHSVALLKAINDNVIDNNEALNQSIRLGVMTTQTSFILVDERSTSEKEKYRSESIEIPIKKQNVDFIPRRKSVSSLYSIPMMMMNSFRSAGLGSTLRASKTENYMKMQMDENGVDAGDSFADDERGGHEEFVGIYNNNDNNNNCSAVSSLQKSNGNWNLTEVLNTLNIKLNETETIEWSNKDDKDILLAGLFAIEHLKNSCSSVYKLVIEKGNSYIQNKYSQQMIDLAQKVVVKYLKVK